MWRNAFTAALKRLSPFASQANTASCPQANADACHTASSMSGTPSTDVTAQLERRALMLHNRNREEAAKYVARHKTLIRES